MDALDGMDSIVGQGLWVFAFGIWVWSIFASRVVARGLSRRQFAAQIYRKFLRNAPIALGIVLVLGTAIIPISGAGYVVVAAIMMLYAWMMVFGPILLLVLLNRRSWFWNWS